MPRLPSAQDINRQTPSYDRQFVALPEDPTGKLMQQTGNQLQQTGAQLQKQAIKTQRYEAKLMEQERQKVTQLQKAQSQTGVVQDLNDWYAQELSNPDYSTKPKRFNEFAQKTLQKYSSNISDERERSLFELSAKQDISNYGLKLNENAYEIRNKQLVADLDVTLDRTINQISATDDPNTMQRLMQTQIAYADSLIGAGILPPSKKPEIIKNLQNSVAFSQLSKKSPQDLLKIFNGNSGGFDAAVDIVLQNEGGYVANDGNSGAPANFGINQRANPDIDVANLTADKAKQLYKERYWDKYNLEQVPNDVQAIVFDGVVNHRSDFAKELVDAAKNGASLDDIKNMRNEEYMRLASLDPAKYEQFLGGWQNRLTKFDGNDDAALLGYVTPAQQKTLRNTTYGYVKNNISTEFDGIKKATSENAVIPNEVFANLVTQANQVGEPELANEIKTYGDNQQNISLFSGRSIDEQVDQLSALQLEMANGNTKNAELFALLSETHTENLKRIEENPLDYYAKSGLTAPVVPLDLSSQELDSNAMFRELISRRESINEIKSFEGNNPDIPILSDDEVNALKVDFEKGEPSKFVAKIAALKEVMTPDELERVAYKAFKANSSFAVALAQEPQVATAIIEGERLPDPLPKKAFQTDLQEQFNGMFVAPSQVEGLTNALWSYYKAQNYNNLQSTSENKIKKKFSTNTTPDSDLLTKVITDIMGEPVKLDNGSKVFSFKDNAGNMVDEDILQSAIDDLTDKQIIQINGGLPRSDMGDVSVDEWRDNAILASIGDGQYGVILNGARLLDGDGKTFVLNLKKIINGN
jgi:hypothetical protein